MKKVVKGKTKKYYEEEEVAYVCETCGTEYKNSYEIERCIVCDKDVCPNCTETKIAKFHGMLQFRKLVEGVDVVFYDSGAPTITAGVYLYKVHKECVSKGMEPKKYTEELESIVNYFNDCVKWLNSNTIEGNKTKEHFLRDSFYKQLIELKTENEKLTRQVQDYEEKLKN